MTEWVTQASDFITQNWAALLGVIGGSGGIVAIITLIGKIILTCVQAHYTKKNNTPLQTVLAEVRLQVMEQIKIYNEIIDEIKEQAEQMREEVKAYIREQIEKSQRLKLAVYEKLEANSEDAKELLETLNSKETEVLSTMEENSPVEPFIEELEQVPEIVDNAQITPKDETVDAQKIAKKKKHKRMTVER